MTGTMFFNMLLNIGLLVLLATLLTNMASVRKLFRGESSTIIQKMALAVIFGAISIVSTYTGTKTGGAIVNTRVIGVLTAGIMGGPLVGMMTALIAGAHRFLFDIGGFTAASCAVSTLVEGVLGSLVYKKYKAGEMDSIALLFAIQNLKPSPFCLLDEIEAALDDSNVDRYAKYLHKLTKHTQFIVITHRRGTMVAADRLYGITMQEKGVSTLVSVNLIENDLK